MRTRRCIESGLPLMVTIASLLVCLVGPHVPVVMAAGLTVPSLIGDHMVLQRGIAAPIWGTANPGATVGVTFGGQTTQTIANPDGTWRVDLPSMAATTSPGTMTITSGGQALIFTDVQVGEVWGCSGQSNMEFSLASSDGGSVAVADAPNHNLRLFRVPGNTTPDQVVWKVSDAATAGAFSAVCYYFGLELSEQLNVPIGLIPSTKSGTPIEQWAHVSGPRSGVLYESKIKPLMPYAIKGFLWYQGEDNSRDSTNVYLAKLQALIDEWRTAWGQGDFPFGIVQLPFGRKPATQEAQLQAFLADSQTFLAVTSDLPALGGTAGHPANKHPVGLRLAIGARAIVYGDGTEELVGPIRDPAASSSYVSGGTVVIGFTHVGRGLVTGSEWQPAEAPTPFRVAGSDGKFYAATATIDGNSVRVSSPSVLNPVSVRYTYTYGMGNLYSAVIIPIEGGASTYTRLPASPFELTFGP